MKRIGFILLCAMVVATLSLAMVPLPARAAAPVISSVSASTVTEDAAVISWVTDKNATSNLVYGTAQGGPYPISAPAPADTTADNTSHAVILTGLAAHTTYYYQVKSSDGVEETTSTEYSFTTRAFTISGVTASSITLTSATITWATSVNATSNVEYGLNTGYGSASPVDASADNLIHVVNLSGLAPGTTYHYRVKSSDGTYQELSGDFTFATLKDTTGPAISSVAPSGITIGTPNTAAITWDTDEAATSQVEYGTASATHGSYTSTTPVDGTLLTSHSVAIGGLSPSITYYYRVISQDTYANETVSAEYSFTTAADTTQPGISGIAVSGITTTTAIIEWDTDEPATSQVDYGTSLPYAQNSPKDPSLVTSHAVALSGLTPNTIYHYRVRSDDAAVPPNEAASTDSTFTTTTDTTPPTISSVAPSGGIYIATATTATITWNTNEPATGQVEYGLTPSYGSTTPLNPALVLSHSISLSGLQSGTLYYYKVKSLDASGNAAESSSSFTTADITPPTTPTNIARTTPTSDNTPTFTWDAATDASSGVGSYQVSIDAGAFTGIGNVTTYTHPTALSDGSHTFAVRAVDNAVNIGQSGSLPFNIDATPPTTPTNLTISTPQADNTPTFTWTDSTDATSGLERYQVSLDGGAFTDIGGLATYTIAVALADGNHTIQVKAEDRAGNVSSAIALAFTIDATPPTAPTNLARTTPDSDTTPTFSWDAATDATSGVASYQVRIDAASFTNIGNVTTCTAAQALPAGSHTFVVRAVDNAGNTGASASLDFQITAPTKLPLIIGGAVGGVLVVAALVYFLWIRK